MSNILAKIGIIGDTHLNSKNYGAHRNYPKESLEYFNKVTEITREQQLTHLIGTGDFSYGRFHSLEYRLEVEKNLEEQNEITKGNRYELKGNHDSAGYGFTERDYYIEKGLLHPSCNFQIGNLNLSMVDYWAHENTPVIIEDTLDKVNMIIVHDYFKFENSGIGNFGKSIDLDKFEKWYGVDYIVAGHIHKIMKFTGYMIKDNIAHETTVDYLGCMNRPAYREGSMDEVGRMLVVTVFDDAPIDISYIDIPLWSLQAKQKQKQIEKEKRIDISDIVKQLDAHDRNMGNPEDIIESMEGIDERYKKKAIDLLSQAMG